MAIACSRELLGASAAHTGCTQTERCEMATNVPENPETLLTRDAVAAALTARGYPVKSKTLATKASRGGGPPFRHFGLRVLYRWSDALAWAEGRLSPPRGSTSEGDAQHAA
jgi:hypothetical protein